eukprot:361720-Chlamydomonas_euryale.AAC.5
MQYYMPVAEFLQVGARSGSRPPPGGGGGERKGGSLPNAGRLALLSGPMQICRLLSMKARAYWCDHWLA